MPAIGATNCGGGSAAPFDSVSNKRIFRPYRGKLTGVQPGLLRGRTVLSSLAASSRKKGGTSGNVKSAFSI